MGDLRNNSAVIDLGSGLAKWILVDTDGTTSGTAYSLPWIKSAKLTDNTDETEIETDGETVFVDTGKRSLTLELVVMQKDKDTLKWMVETMRNQYVAIFKQISDKAIDGNYLYWLGAICKVIPSADILIGKGVESTWKFRLLPITSSTAVTFDCGTLFDGGFKKTITGTLSFSLSGTQYWDILSIAE